MTEARLSLGRLGEDLAVRHLEQRGFTILARNHRTPVGELDIVARDRSHLLFIEVKTRRSTAFGVPAEAVGARKQRQIVRAAQWYLASRRFPDLQPRFDVIAVIAGRGEPAVTHIANAFGL
ncbi:MAG: YraN family protein [Deltaproteobacteria bacterium]|nr:MAG: YraN family protein [Deltaproteobacteria bacterium]